MTPEERLIWENEGQILIDATFRYLSLTTNVDIRENLYNLYEYN